MRYVKRYWWAFILLAIGIAIYLKNRSTNLGVVPVAPPKPALDPDKNIMLPSHDPKKPVYDPYSDPTYTGGMSSHTPTNDPVNVNDGQDTRYMDWAKLIPGYYAGGTGGLGPSTGPTTNYVEY